MADPTVSLTWDTSSQHPGSQQENLPASPANNCDAILPELGKIKPRALPTVTPKRFTKFFTPRNFRSGRGGSGGNVGRQLRDITRNGVNRRRSGSDLRCSSRSTDSQESRDVPERLRKRRKRSVDLASSPPLHSSPLKHIQSAAHGVQILEDLVTSPMTSEDETLDDTYDHFHTFPPRLRRLRQGGTIQRILQRSFGGHDALLRGIRAPDHAVDPRAYPAGFVSIADDTHWFNGTALPFCTASCNTNSLIAIGEEEGGVRLIDTASVSDFAVCHVAFRPHNNAIMDLAFSADDYTLATASGDQTIRIIDMQTQSTTCILSGHKSSVKQVCFNPSDANVLTSSSRDGSVQIWDLRCGPSGPVQSLKTRIAHQALDGKVEPGIQYAKSSLEVGRAYRSVRSAEDSYTAKYTDVAGASITAIQHLPHGREHLLLTASEANSSIKLWDLRHASRRKLSTPLSSTSVPLSHTRTRDYGTNAMAVSTDGSRLYALCRDSVVYAYSTNHLLLGSAPEMSPSNGRCRMLNTSRGGLGPLYGLKHAALRTGTFYVKASLRKESLQHSEMLAVGSSEQCAVVFPTDERSTLPRMSHSHPEDEEDYEGELPSLISSFSQTAKSASSEETTPIYEQGSALIRGHEKEVTSVSWTHDGDLVTVADDFRARCWRWDESEARELRACGEGRGRRWGCGWADVDVKCDADDA